MNSQFCADYGSPDAIRFEDESFSVDHAGLITGVKGFIGMALHRLRRNRVRKPGRAQLYAAASDELVLRAREFEGTEISVSMEIEAQGQTVASHLSRIPTCRT